jgi:hypothetical protein
LPPRPLPVALSASTLSLSSLHSSALHAELAPSLLRGSIVRIGIANGLPRVASEFAGSTTPDTGHGGGGSRFVHPAFCRMVRNSFIGLIWSHCPSVLHGVVRPAEDELGDFRPSVNSNCHGKGARDRFSAILRDPASGEDCCHPALPPAAVQKKYHWSGIESQIKLRGEL